MDRVTELIQSNQGKDIIIIGYSRGGNAAINIVNRLGNNGVFVNELITFDPHRLVGSNFTLRNNNVGRATNFFQRNPTTGIFGVNPFQGSSVSSTFINVNQPVPASDIGHNNIVRRALSGTFSSR